VLAPEVRLLTLTGPGGIGKTRLALAVAERLIPTFADEVYWVALAPITDPGLVMSAIAQSLSTADLGQRTIEEQVISYLQERRALIVIDNFEQVSDAASQIADILSQCPDVAMLVTSRSPLRIRGEQVFPVQPLAVPRADRATSIDDAQWADSVRLFIERARSVRPEFALTPDNASALTDLCRRLEGVPLAIELAAARVNVLSPQGMLARLDPSLPLLVGGPRDQPARLQTMRDAIQWSWDLLSPAEQALLRRMAVFRGGCMLESLQVVAGTDLSGSVLDTLSSLVDHNLVYSADEPGGEPRFDMFVVVREFALEQLATSNEAEETRHRHSDYVLTLAETSSEHYYGPEATVWLDRMDREHDNIRAALEFFAETGACHELLRLSKAAGEFWYWRAHLQEGRRWLELALSSDDRADPLLRSLALSWLADLVYEQGDYQYSHRLTLEALDISRRVQDIPSTILALQVGGVALWMMGEASLAHASWDEALGLARTVGDVKNIELITWLLSYSALILGDLDQAARLSEESLALSRESKDKVGIACGLFIQGWLAALGDDYDRAWGMLLDGAKLSAEVGDLVRTAFAMGGLGAVAAMRGHDSQTAILVGAAAEIYQSGARPLTPSEESLHRDYVEAARSRLGESQWHSLFARGQAMPLDEALEFASSPYHQHVEVAPTSHVLTPRQVEVLQLVADGLSDREIAERLFISPHTVMRHVANILNTLGVESRTAAATYALRNNLL
jgi:predicted ATPase/DNA-binding NarL/FixJ family response regulator